MMLSTMMKYLITIPNNYVSVLMLSTIFDMMKSVKGIGDNLKYVPFASPDRPTFKT